MKLSLLFVCFLTVLVGCVSRQRDHFYVLDAHNTTAPLSRIGFERQVTLRISVPSILDRPEMVLTTASGIAVLEHERWAAPLAELMTTALGQDIEQRRADVVVVTRGTDVRTTPLITIAVEIVQLTARVGEPAVMETRWRITDAGSGKATMGRDSFTSPARASNYVGIASALSACLDLLAARLVTELPSS
jgi:uncharacterized lipoprotein YmbA